MRRAKLVLTVALAGCMRIYPDPELPDLDVEWQDFDCANGGIVTVVVTGVDTPSTVLTQTVDCSALGVTFKDVARERYQVNGTITNGVGMPIAEEPVDLRAGFNKTVSLFFGAFINFNVEWTFDGGDSCAILDAGEVLVMLTASDSQFAFSAFCSDGFFGIGLGPGTFTAHLVARTATEQIVATSPETAPFTITDQSFTDLGLQTLTACGSACP